MLLAGATSVSAIDLPAGVLPDLGTSKGAASAAATPAPTMGEWAARLDAARASHRLLLAQRPGSAPLLEERQAASERRLMLLAAWLEAQRAPEQGHAPEASASAPAHKLQGEAPFSAVDVDALRDHLDALRVQQATLRLTLKSFDAEVEAAVAARTAANAEVRLQRDRAAQGRETDSSGELRAQAELAGLQAEAAELDLLQAENTRVRARGRLAALEAPMAQAQAEVDRVRNQLKLDDAALAAMTKRFQAEARVIAAERTRLAEQLARREAESGGDGALKLREVEALRQAVATLRELESLETSKAGLWRARQQLLAADQGPAQKQEAAAAQTRAIDQTQARLQLAGQRSDFLRAELRSQQSLLRGLPEGDPARVGEQRVLDAMAVELGAHERLQAALYRVGVLQARNRSDLGVWDRPENTMGWVQRAYALTAEWLLAVWNYELFSASETTQIDGRSVTVDHGVTVGKSIGVLAMFVLGYWAASRLSSLLVTGLSRRLHLTMHLERMLARWFKTLLVLVVLMTALKMARIPITAFAFLGGALVLGIGVGAQNVFKNLICGVILLFERKIRVGDIVSVGGMSGTVLSVDLRATTIRGFDGVDAIVPNSNLLENPISNWSGGNPNIRRTVDVSVATGCDVRKASQILLDCAAANSAVLTDPPADVLLVDFGGSKLTLRLQYWVRLDSGGVGPEVDSRVRFAILDALASDDVEVTMV